MRTVLFTILICIGSAVSAQNVLDSIQLYDFPVKQGVIYKYEYKSNPTQTCASNLCIVSVVTHNDSVYHFENGKVAGVFTIDDSYAIVIQNAKNEFITYSNLQEVTLKKGDKVTKGMCVGTIAEGGDDVPGMNQVDILVLRKIKQLPYRKTIEYIRSKSTPRKIYYSTL
jgi:hypothetical protein